MALISLLLIANGGHWFPNSRQIPMLSKPESSAPGAIGNFAILSKMARRGCSTVIPATKVGSTMWCKPKGHDPIHFVGTAPHLRNNGQVQLVSIRRGKPRAIMSRENKVGLGLSSISQCLTKKKFEKVVK